MRYTENKLTSEEQIPHLAPRSLEDHLNLSPEQLNISFSEKFQAINYINEHLSIEGELQFYPSDYYDPQIKLTEKEPIKIHQKDSKNKRHLLLVLGLVATVIIAFQVNWFPTEKAQLQPAHQAPLKEASNFSKYFKHAGATLNLGKETTSSKTKQKTALKTNLSSKEMLTNEATLQFNQRMEMDLPDFDLTKMAKSITHLPAKPRLSDLPKPAGKAKEQSIATTKEIKENITDIQPKLAISTSEKDNQTKTYSRNTPSTTSVDESVSRESVSLMKQLSKMQLDAKSSNKAYFLKFGASWCLPCQIMEETTFQDETLLDLIKTNYLYLDVNVALFDGITLQQKYQIEKLPTILIFDQYGRVLEKIETGITASKLIKTLEKHQNKSMAGL